MFVAMTSPGISMSRLRKSEQVMWGIPMLCDGIA